MLTLIAAGLAVNIICTWLLSGHVQEQGDRVMSKFDEMVSAIDSLTTGLKDATDEIARDLQKLRDELKAALGVDRDGLTATEAEALRVKMDRQLGAAVERLTILGADPEDPIPAPPSVVPAAGGEPVLSTGPTPGMAPATPTPGPNAVPPTSTPASTTEPDPGKPVDE